MIFHRSPIYGLHGFSTGQITYGCSDQHFRMILVVFVLCVRLQKFQLNWARSTQDFATIFFKFKLLTWINKNFTWLFISTESVTLFVRDANSYVLNQISNNRFYTRPLSTITMELVIYTAKSLCVCSSAVMLLSRLPFWTYVTITKS